MTSLQAVAEVISVLEAENMPYMLVGSLASAQYGLSRNTKDADFLVELGTHPITAITRHLGEAFELDPQIMFESVTGSTRHVVNIPSLHFSVEFFRLSGQPYDQERFSRRRRLLMPQVEREAFVSSPEDVVVTKLQWANWSGRSKDRQDVFEVISARGVGSFDWEYIHRWCDEHGTRTMLDEILTSLPPG